MKLFMITNEEGALTQLRCATDETLAKSTGRYFDKQREIPSNPVAEGEDVGRELFERSSELVRKALARA
jgi:hypothetical protein